MSLIRNTVIKVKTPFPSLGSFDDNVRYLLEEVAAERKQLSERYAAQNRPGSRTAAPHQLSVEGLGCRDNRSLRDGLYCFSQPFICEIIFLFALVPFKFSLLIKLT
jgi:hypothetical protein